MTCKHLPQCKEDMYPRDPSQFMTIRGKYYPATCRYCSGYTEKEIIEHECVSYKKDIENLRIGMSLLNNRMNAYMEKDKRKKRDYL